MRLRLARDREQAESRSLAPPTVDPTFPLVTGSIADVNTSNALRVADAYACVRVLADGVSSLPLHAYRRTAQGRVAAGEESRINRLLAQPAPGSTIVDLISLVMVHLNVYGEAFIGKYRSEGEVVQLGLIPPPEVEVELRGQRIVYRLSATGREHGPDDILHVKGMSSDGLRGLSPVTAARLALTLSASLQESGLASSTNGSRPSGILTVPNPQSSFSIEEVREKWDARHGGAENAGRVAVMTGDVAWTPVAFSAADSQFLQQRELSAREVARIFRVPAWSIDAPTGDSLTYANVMEQSRALVDYSLRPWLVRIERAVSGDADLCPGSTYVQFDLDGLLRGDAGQRSEIYTRALNPATGWLTRPEVRELEELPPENDPEPAVTPAVIPAQEPAPTPEVPDAA